LGGSDFCGLSWFLGEHLKIETTKHTNHTKQHEKPGPWNTRNNTERVFFRSVLIRLIRPIRVQKKRPSYRLPPPFVIIDIAPEIKKTS